MQVQLIVKGQNILQDCTQTMKEEDNPKKIINYCVVCDERKERLYEIADCGHKFCDQCCIGYITSQAENFAKAKCLQQGCQAELNKNKPIYKILDKETINRIQNYDLFLFLQNNKDAVACKKKDCKGYFLKSANNGICTVCSSTHCQKCQALQHPGPCEVNTKQQEEMRALNYRKCPKCSIWVEKIAGCEYINCKCGVQFCYKCGAEYAKDPCRKAEVWRKEAEIRKLMNKLRIAVPSDLPSIFLLFLRALVFLLIVVPFTALYCLVPMVVIVGVVEVLVFLFMPIVVFYGISSTDCDCRWLGYLLAVLFYPVIGAFFALVAFIILFIYPFARNKYHHGVYDPLDMLMCHMTVFYLKFVNMVILCCD